MHTERVVGRNRVRFAEVVSCGKVAVIQDQHSAYDPGDICWRVEDAVISEVLIGCVGRSSYNNIPWRHTMSKVSSIWAL